MTVAKMTVAKLALEDGSVFTGTSFGAAGTTAGEVVFNTSMTGYQEILTDPSYRGQIVAMSFPQIGNVGVNDDDRESARPQLGGFVVRELSRRVSNWRQTQSLGDYLADHGIPGLAGIDTRSLILTIRDQGAMRGILTTELVDDDVALLAAVCGTEGLVGRDLAKSVMPAEAKPWTERIPPGWRFLPSVPDPDRRPFKVVALDFGMKWNIGRCLAECGCEVVVLPGTATADEIAAHEPDGVFLSNGPGDPEPLGYAVETVRQTMRRQPVFGICLGHQLLGQALGAKTFKLKFGHRGSNQPVRDLRSGRIEITTQNHGFAVDPDTLPDCAEATHVNLNDQTLAGLRHRELPVFGVQYHPEASSGPHDSAYLFDEFVALMARHRDG